MLFQRSLFLGRKSKDTITKYRTYYLGAFYDCFSDDGKEFHLAEEDKESFLERLYLYRTQVLKKKAYPIIDIDGQIRLAYSYSPLVLKQYLGLPLDIFQPYKGVSGEELLDLILPHVHFDKDIKKEDLRLEGNDIGKMIVEDDDFCLRCIDYLLENGIYMPHLDLIVTEGMERQDFLPAFCDERKVPKDFVKATASRLLFSFGDKAIFQSLHELEKFRQFVDSKNLEEQFYFAYATPAQDDMELVAQGMLFEYFNCLIRRILNRFFYEKFAFSEAFKPSVLDEEIDTLPYANHSVAIGMNFVMTAKSTLYEEEKDGVVSFVERKGKYSFSWKDKEALRFAFEKVQEYCRNQNEYIYPELFLRLMGVPYACLDSVHFFSFQEGDSDSFLNQLSFDDFDILDQEIPFFDLIDGRVLLYRNKDSLPFQHHLLVREGLFPLFLDNTALNCEYLLFASDHVRSLLPENFLEKAKPILPKIEKEIQSWADRLDVASFEFSSHDEQAIHRILAGENSVDVYSLKMGNAEPIPQQFLSFRALLLILHVLSQVLPNVRRRLKRRRPVLFYDNAPREEIVLRDGQHFFLTDWTIYSVKDGQVFFLKEDEELLKKAQKILNGRSYAEQLLFFGRYVLQTPGFLPEERRLTYTGLPRPTLELALKNGISFKEESFFENPKFKDAILSSPILLPMMARRKALKDGILIYGNGLAMSSLLGIPKETSEDLRFFLEPDLFVNVAMDLIGNVWKVNGLKGGSRKRVHEVNSQVSAITNTIIYRTRFASLLDKEVPDTTGFRYDPKIGYYVAHGLFFDCYSKTGEKGTFFLDNRDRKSFENFWKIAQYDKLFSHKMTVNELISFCHHSLLPLPLVESFLEQGNLKPSFPFRELEKRSLSDCFDSYLRTKKTLSDPYDSGPFLRELLEEGILLENHEDIVNWKRTVYLALRKGQDALYHEMKHLLLSALPKPSGLAKEMFFPNPVTYQTLLETFEKEYHEIFPDDMEFSNFQAMLEEAYRIDSGYLFRILFQEGELDHLEGDNIYLFRYRFEEERILRFTDFQMLFCYYVLTEYCYRIWQRILRRDRSLF